MKIINNRLNNTDRYSERGMTYTKNGALTRLLRYGRRNTDDFGLVDSLVMTLDGNRVLSVEDGAGRLVYENSFDFKSNGGSSVYEYDGNGSLSVDPYKGFAFEYDLLGNLKRTESEYTTSYVYSSTGERLSVESKFNGCIAKPHQFFFSDWEEGGVIFNATSDDSGDSDIMDRWKKAGVPRDTEFCGPFIFEYSVLDKFLFDGGYCTFKDGQASFHYYLTDHLGNNRAVVAEDGTVEQTTEYYPFGGIYGDVSTNPGLQLYKYNGKEFDHSLSLDLYDYGARLYDPALVVWTGVDPLADEYGGISPYVYCLSNPVNRIDPDGRKVKPDEKSYAIILNTLSDAEKKYVVLTDGNIIDNEIMSQCNSQSNNFLALQMLVESQYIINVTSLSETQYVKNGEMFSEYFSPVEVNAEFKDINFTSSVGNTTGECGNLGVTYMPTNDGKGKSPIGNNSIHININPTLSDIGAAEVFSHEGYGHAYIYVYTNGNREKAVHHYLKGGRDSNVILTNHSIRARKETIKNLLK